MFSARKTTLVVSCWSHHYKILPDCGRGSDFVFSLHVLINVMWMNTEQIVWLYRLERLSWAKKHWICNKATFPMQIWFILLDTVMSAQRFEKQTTDCNSICQDQISAANINIWATSTYFLLITSSLLGKGLLFFQSQYRNVILNFRSVLLGLERWFSG